MGTRGIQALVLSFLLAWLSACGGRSITSANGNPNPQPTGTPTTYITSLVQVGTGIVVGTLTVNATADNGSGVAQVSGVAANSSFNIRFCPFPTGTATCSQVTSLSTDGAGNGQTTFTFPMHGTLTGIFIGGRGGMDEFDGGFDIPVNGSQFQAALVPAASVSGGLQPGLTIGSDTLKKGQVSVTSGTSVHIVLQAAVANATYGLTFCLNGGGSGCYATGTFTTDGSGNATVDLDFTQGFGIGTDLAGVFLLGRDVGGGSGAEEFVTAFRVP